MAAMARASSKTPKSKVKLRDRPKWLVRVILRYVLRGILIVIALAVVATLTFSAINPPTTPYMFSEGRRVGGVNQTWVPMEDIAPVMARSAVAAEDANFCTHWGLDLTAIRAALEAGGGRGGSTISQQVVKNVYLWHGRSWLRKSLEALMTPLVEAVWSKERILEVYLNVAEFDEGVFGVEAAAVHYFGVTAADLTPTQAARLAAVLPAPQSRSASQPTSFVRSRAASIMDGAATIAADGRAGCFE
ncbi:monofunctional biosynthetic peptidoglycan transglycosylase [Pseudooctadecabacter jejudonensis]|uniref:Biosynthetic peptidoglycan transglycosylase n=1 Tax=Pseudooctadecabacter jejudonensis TaxID=1391910 RepID=A0A1Y5S7Y8_9RHOB|nr:monofunctional biosynthetic peptidoglycan transglycosylase [Pseudooctadecabacter jejudonensis]SLN34389.1 Penicillin-binding protein 2D [Pseudooctadecabacter jejudonensis]